MNKFILFLLISTCILIYAEDDKKLKCKGAAVSWQSPESCKAEEGNWVASDDDCNYEWLGKKPEGSICCLGCTDDSMEEMGID